MKPENKYISAVLQRLIDEPMVQWFGTQKDGMMLPISEVIIVPKDPKHPNYPKTVEAWRYIIDYGMDVANGFVLTLNRDATKIKKTIYINQNPKSNDSKT